MERRKDHADNIDWVWYFRKISKVCPWAYKSYFSGTTKFEEYDSDILELNDLNWSSNTWEVIVYLVGDTLSLDELDHKVKKLNKRKSQCEYFWSHPSFSKGGNNQTPTAAIIQQDRARLEEIRNASKKSKRRLEVGKVGQDL